MALLSDCSRQPGSCNNRPTVVELIFQPALDTQRLREPRFRR